MSDSTLKYPAALVPVGAFAGKPAMPLTRPILVVGSGKHSRILLKSDTVSSVHTLLILSNGRWYFRDLASRTHTILNGKSARESTLKNGDTITIGAFVFHFVAPEPTSDNRPPAPAALDITDAEIPVPIDTKTVLIGKRHGCEVRLMDDGVSTAHAVIFECNGAHYIRDLYSRGGTFLNGRKVHQEILRFGDEVVVGETRIKYIQDLTAPAELSALADEPARPMVLLDDAMASHEAPLVAHDLPSPLPVADTSEPPAEPVRKPAEIRANLPEGLSSLLGEVKPIPAPLEEARREEARRDVFEVLPIDEADDLVVPLRRRTQVELPSVEVPAESKDAEPKEVEAKEAEVVEAQQSEVAPSAIAPEVDEIRHTAEPVEPIDEHEAQQEAEVHAEVAEPAADVPAPSVAALAAESEAVVDEVSTTDDIADAVASVEEVRVEPAAFADVETPEVVEVVDTAPAVANAPVEAYEPTAARQEVEEADEQVEPVAEQVEPAVEEVGVADKPDASTEEQAAEVAEADAPVVAAELPVAEKSVAVTVDSLSTAPEASAGPETAATPETAAPTAEVLPPPIDVDAFAEQVRREFVGVEEAPLQAAWDEQDETPAKQDEPLATADQSAALQDEADAAPEQVSPQEPVTIDELATADQSLETASSVDELAPTAADAVATPIASEPAEVVAETAGPKEEPLEVIEQSPELRQLAELQARISAALEDPSTVAREPILPPDAPLVSDPTSSMSAAARRARLIAEMLEETEPIEEEAEREAQSISFDIDEAALPVVDLAPQAKVPETIEPVEVDPAALAEPIQAEPIEAEGNELAADWARSDETTVSPVADLVSSPQPPAYPVAESLPLDEVSSPGFALPSAVELSELPVFESDRIVELKSEYSRKPAEIEPPAAESLGEPIEFDDIEPLVDDASAEPTTRKQDVFDSDSLSSLAADLELPVQDQPIEPSMLDEDETRAGNEADAVAGVLETFEVEPVQPEVDHSELAAVEPEPLVIEPVADEQSLSSVDAPAAESDLVSESADDTLVGAAQPEPLLDTADSLSASETADAAETVDLTSEVAAPEDLSAEQDVQASPFGSKAATFESDSITIDAEAQPAEAPRFDTPVEVFEASIPDVEKPALEVEVPETVAELAAQPDEMPVEVNDPIAPVEADEYNAGEVIITAADVGPEAAVRPEPATEVPAPAAERIITEAEENEPLEGQSRPLIAVDEHLIEDDEVASIDSTPAAQAASEEKIEVDVSAPVEVAFDAGTTPFAQEPEPVAETPTRPLEPLEPIVAEGTVEAAKRPVMVEDAGSRADKPRAMNIAVPSLEDLQAEFDSAFADALAMAEGKSFADPAQANAPVGETPPQEQPPVQESAPEIAPLTPQRAGNVMDLKVPPLEALEAEFRDSFAEALAMAEGHTFAKPKFDRSADQITPTPSAEVPKERSPREFKLDESLLDQAGELGATPLGGSGAPSGSAAFMNLGGIGWIGDETLDDFEIPTQRKPKAKPRRSRQRRPVGDVLTPPPTLAEAQGDTELPAAEISRDTNPETVSPPVPSSPAVAAHAGSVPSVDETDFVDELATLAEPDVPVTLDEKTEATAATAALDSTTEADAMDELDLSDLLTQDMEDDAADRAKPPAVPQAPTTAAAEASPPAPKPLPEVIPPRPTNRPARSARPRKGEALVDEALSAPSSSPFAAQELPLVDAFSGASPPAELDEVLARLNTSGGSVKDHPPISQDRPIGEAGQVKVPVSPFASQVPIAQPAGNVRRVRQRVSKLPMIGGLMLVLTLLASMTWFLPVRSVVRGELKFKNLERTPQLVQREIQRSVLDKLPTLQAAARRHVEDFEGGFLNTDKSETYAEIIRNARFDPQSPNILVIEVPSNVNQAPADQKRLDALMSEVVRSNKDQTDAVNKLIDETKEIERIRGQIDTQLAEVKKKYDELGVIYETGTLVNTQLKKIERELATLEESRKAASREIEAREAQLKQLEAQMLSAGLRMRVWPLLPELSGVALADASGNVPALGQESDLPALLRERDELKARIDRLSVQQSPETSAARQNFDRALDEFSKQVEAARNTLGDRPEVLEYVKSASKLQEQIREMTDTLVRRQEQQITRLNEFQMRLKEHTDSAQERRVNGDPQLKAWMDDLAFQERRLNVAKESGSAAEDIRDIERNIAFLKSNIAAKQELLADPKEALMVADIQKMIDETKKDMAADRDRNDAVLAEVQNVFKSRQPILEALPDEQKQVTEALTQRLAQIDLARQRYTDSLAAVSGSDEVMVADARKKLQALDDSIALAQARQQQVAQVELQKQKEQDQAQAVAQAQSKEMERRAELARKIDDARAKAIEARKAFDDIESQYRTKLAARDALAAKVTDWKTAAADREQLSKQQDELNKKRGDLIVRRSAIEQKLEFAVVPDPSPKFQVIRNRDADPRLRYFSLAMLCILGFGGGWMLVEKKNRIAVPATPEESSDSQTPVSGTPTVA